MLLLSFKINFLSVLGDQFQWLFFSSDFNLTRGIVEKRIGGWPQKTDLDAAVSAIFRLWNFYQFDLHKFLHGKIFEVNKDATIKQLKATLIYCFSVWSFKYESNVLSLMVGLIFSRNSVFQRLRPEHNDIPKMSL